MKRERRLVLGVSAVGIVLAIVMGLFFALVIWAALQLD
jgi:tetrahydromethanopterin S-methyltransferase subunit F